MDYLSYFRKNHYKAMNAQSESEKSEINQQMKDYYEALPTEEKLTFNEQLQKFLVAEYAKISEFGSQLNPANN